MFYLTEYEMTGEYTQKSAELAVQFYGEEHPEIEDIMCMCYLIFHSLWLTTKDERYRDFEKDLGNPQ